MGWSMIVVDFLWAYDNPPGSMIGNPFQLRLGDGAYVPMIFPDPIVRLKSKGIRRLSVFAAALWY